MAILKNLLVNGSARFLNTLYANDLTVSGTTTFAGISASSLTVSGNATINGTTTLKGTKLTGTLTIVNAASLNTDTVGLVVGGDGTGNRTRVMSDGLQAVNSDGVKQLYLNYWGGVVSLGSGNQITANNGTFTTPTLNATKSTINNLYVPNELRAVNYNIETVSHLGGAFFVAPSIEVPAGNNVSITAISGNTITATISDNSITTTAFSPTWWCANSLVKIAGSIAGIPIGTCSGTLTSALVAGRVVVQFTYTGQSEKPLSVANSQASSGLSVTLTTIGGTKPIGIYMTALGQNNWADSTALNKTAISIYGGTTDGAIPDSTNPVVRIGNLAGLPKVNNEQPVGWGIYTNHGYFSGLIVSNSGKIGNFTISDALYSTTKAFGTTANNVYIGDDGISLGTTFKVTKAGVLTATSGSIGGSVTIGGTAASTILSNITNAAKTATNYLTQISGTTGISVHDSGDTNNFVNMNSNGVFVYKGGTQRAQFADTTIIGKPFVDGASNNESHVEIGSNYLKLVSKDNTPYFQVQDLRDPSTGLASLEELYIGDGTTTVFQLGLTASNNTYTVKQNGTIVSPTKTVTKVTFATAPALNDEILIIYTSSDPNAKAFTYGSRDPLSNVGAMSFAEGFQVESEGPFSHAEGYRSNASGRYSHAEGNNTTASGNFSHAEGYTTNASGYNSHAEGYHTEASGGISHAEGQSTIASGSYSHAEGRSTSATNSESHAEGYGTEASGSYSHAEGSSTTASGMDSHAEGSHTVASGWHSHAEGSGNTATSSAAHAEGYGTNATGNYSHAEGRLSTASGIYSHAQNLDTKATMSAQTVIGTRNIADTTPSTAVHPSGLTDYGNYAFIIGNGTADDARSNALIVDWNGGLEMYLDVDSSANASTAATSGTDKDLFNAIQNLGWVSNVID